MEIVVHSKNYAEKLFQLSVASQYHISIGC